MIKRLYVEKRPELAHEAQALHKELQDSLGLKNLQGVRIINRYDVEGLTAAQFEQAVPTVFSEPPVDEVNLELQVREGETLFAVEPLPGQVDQRADSAIQCLQMQTLKDRPLVHAAKVYALSGSLTAGEIAAVKRHLINPVETREAGRDMPDSLVTPSHTPPAPPVLHGFRGMKDSEMAAFLEAHALSMDQADLQVCMDYFNKEGRDPTETELMVLDTYWSDHCRHTTFLTAIRHITCEDPAVEKSLKDYLKTREEMGATKPVTLMDVATIAVRALHQQGKLPE